MDHSATSQLYFSGSSGPPFPGGLVPYHSLNGTPELAYGLTEWWELGFYAPFAVSNMGDFLSDGFKFRNLFVSPDAAKRDFFYGVNFEWSYTTPPFSQTRVGLEVRPNISVAAPFVWRCLTSSPVAPVSTPRSSNRTCRSPASGSRTRSHAFTHDGPRPSWVRRTSRKCPYSCESG
jgi:hypothetical protein